MRRLLVACVCALGSACGGVGHTASAATGHDVSLWPSCETFGQTLGALVAGLEDPFTTTFVDEPGVLDGMECRWGQPQDDDADGLRAVLRGGVIRLTIQAGPFGPVPARLRHDDPRAAAIDGFVQSDDGRYDPQAQVDVFAPRVVAGNIRVAVEQMPFMFSDAPGHRLTVDDAVAAAVDIHRALRAETDE